MIDEIHDLPELFQVISAKYIIHGIHSFRLRNAVIEWSIDSSYGLNWFPMWQLPKEIADDVTEWVVKKLIFREVVEKVT